MVSDSNNKQSPHSGKGKESAKTGLEEEEQKREQEKRDERRPAQKENDSVWESFQVPEENRKENYLVHLKHIRDNSGLGYESWRFF